MMVYYVEYESPVGRLLLVANERALLQLTFGSMPEGAQTGQTELLTQAELWLDAYFRGEQTAVAFPLEPEGTAFQKQVWQILQTISWGEVRTYGDIAREMAKNLGKDTMSAQAIGQAVGKNPISILIPCHRVVGAKGKLTGYAWGLDKKQWLLHHETL